MTLMMTNIPDMFLTKSFMKKMERHLQLSLAKSRLDSTLKKKRKFELKRNMLLHEGKESL